MEQGKGEDVIYTDFTKALNTVETGVLLHDLKECGIMECRHFNVIFAPWSRALCPSFANLRPNSQSPCANLRRLTTQVDESVQITEQHTPDGRDILQT